MSHIAMEFGGGLGDMLFQCYERGAYNVLRDLGPEDTAEVHLIVHNPSAPELFSWHPKRNQFSVHHHGYWMPSEDARMRQLHGVPPHGSNYRLPERDAVLTFYPSPDDARWLEGLQPGQYLVMAASAGTPDRILSTALIQRILARVLEQTTMPIVWVGRTYERDGRWEPTPPEHTQIVNLVNQLSLPGTCQLVQRCAGLITTHSSLNLLGWCELRPQLLLYPQVVLDRHSPSPGYYDQWLFGANQPTTVHGLFEDFDESWVDAFLHHCR